MRICVTGCAGFIGSNLIKILLKHGHEIIGIDDLSFGFVDNMDEFKDTKKFEFIQRNILTVHPLLFQRCDIIVHLAAYKIPRFGKTLQCLENNILGLHNLLVASMDKKIIIASSSDVYGKLMAIPFNEKDDLTYGSPEHRRWVYGLSKLVDENFVIGFHEEYKKPYNIARFFNVYGENCALDWTGGCLPQIIGKILKGEPVEIHGDGEQTRCFTYVSDTVDGLVKMIEGKAWNEIFNLGNDYMISINGLVDVVYDIIGKKPNIKYIPYKEFFGKYEDVSVRQPDISKVKSMLKWEPKVKLEQGLIRTIEDQKKRMGL